MSTSPVPMETLLTHRGWVRRLARSLVLDDFTADDVEQRTWLAALRRPPLDADTSRAWLGRVVRRLASDMRRADRRRGGHERAGARPEGVRSTADVVAESEAHMRVVLAVHDLDEPQRTTVLLRWFENLPPRDVADRMGVPVETVRTRLRRAHDALRERLARDAGGGSDWMAALVPLTGLRPETAAGATTAAATKAAAIYGGTVMGTKTVVVAGLAVVAAFVGGTMVRDDGGASEDEVAALRAKVESLETTRVKPAADRQAASATDRQAASATDRRAAGLEARAAEQAARLAAIETQLANMTRELAAVNAAAAERATAPTPTPVRDPTAEQQRLQTLTDDELLRAIRDMIGMDKFEKNKTVDGRAVVDACAVLLARSLDAARRAEALTLKGIGHRVLGDRAAEEAALREALAAVGPNTKEGRSAAYQLAWTAARSDPRGAAESLLRLSQDPDAPAAQRAWNRYYAAAHFEEAGDKDRAVAEYRAVVDGFADSEDNSVRMVVGQARGALERIAKPAKR